ncbi:MAG: 50S ribosomal protein L35 [Phycisphaerae bacterium]
MPKMKTHKGVLKRVRVTAKGKVKHKRSNAGHLMSSKNGNRCRGLRRPATFAKAFRARLKEALAGAKGGAG